MENKKEFDDSISKYVGDVFKERLRELNLSQNRFRNEFASFGCRPTLLRILQGNGTNIKIIQHYAKCLGLELKFVKTSTNEIID